MVSPFSLLVPYPPPHRSQEQLQGETSLPSPCALELVCVSPDRICREPRRDLGGGNWGKGRQAKWPPWLEGDAPLSPPPPHPCLHPGQLLSRSQGLKPEPLVGEGRQLWPGLGAGPGQAGAPRCRGPRNSDPSGQDAPTATGAFGESYSPTHHATQTPRGSGRGPDPAWCLGSPIASGGEAPPHAPQSRGLIFSQD